MANQILNEVDKALEKQLNLQVANWTLMFTKLHNFHWFVKGTDFFTLHKEFEGFYNEAAENIDVIAERLLAIGGTPVATLRETLAIATISEAGGKESAEEMVAAIAADFETIIGDLKKGMDAAVQIEDEATADLLLGIVSSLQKHRWMLNAYLSK